MTCNAKEMSILGCMTMKTQRIRTMALILALMMMAAAIPAAIAAGSFQAVVASNSMNVYRSKAPHSYIGSLPKGTTVTVKAYSGQAALISYNGKTGIARIGDLSATDSAAQAVSAPAATPEPAATASPDELSAAKTVVTNRSTRVYRQASKSSSYVAVKAGTTLGLVAVSGSVAKVINGSAVGYMPAAHLSDPSGIQQTSASKTSEVQKYDRIAVAATAEAKVYAKPSTSSSYVTISKGTTMVLLAVKGNCAMVEKDGKVGYMARSLLTTDVASVPPVQSSDPVKTEEVKVDESEAFSGTDEEITFKFLTGVAGYSTAAACGVMANIKYESGYKATSKNSSGSSYGICQWTGARKTRLINWCRDNGYDYTTLKGQLYFLQYELKRYYPAVHNRLKAVANSDQGAYDAGYDFCYNFEAPSSRSTRSVTRGNYARTTLWKRYST